MKKLFFLFFLVLPSLIFAQSFASLNIFSENGDKFFLILDGKKQNDIARSNIRIEELPDLYYSAKIIFEDAAIAPILKNNLYVSDGDETLRDATYRLRRENGGKPRLTFYSMLPVKQNFVPIADMYVFHFGQPSVFETMPVLEKKTPPSVTASSGSLGSLNVFSQNGDKFFLFLDGVKQNDIAQSNIRISEIPGLFYNVKIIFKDTKTPPIIKNNLFVSDGDDNLMDATYRIRRDNQGKPKLNFFSMSKVQENFTVPDGMFVYSFGKPAAGLGTVKIDSTKKSTEPIKGTITNITVTEHTVAPSSASSKGIVKNKNIKPAEKRVVITEQAATINKPVTTTTKEEAAVKEMPDNKKCNGWPMGKGDLAAAKKLIEETAREEEKLTAAQEIIASNCLLASQVTEFCNLFKSEKSKLAFAKYAYKFTIDRKNYSEVNKALSLETSKKELNRFISGG